MRRVVLITEVKSYLLVSLVSRLKEMNIECDVCEGKIDVIGPLLKDADAVIINVEKHMAENLAAMVFVKDRAVEDDIPVFVLGEDNIIRDMERNFSDSPCVAIFTRPFNIVEVSEYLKDYLKSHNRQNRKNILVVDDNGAMLRNVKGWLGDKYNVIPANSGSRAMKYLANNRPDLILLDYEMPVVDGSQVLGMIREDMDNSDIPVIFLTSKGDKESVMKVMNLKPAGYLLKTMSPEQIIHEVDDFFMRHKS